MKRRNIIVLASFVDRGLLVVALIAAYVLEPTAVASGEITGAQIVLSTPEIVEEEGESTEAETAESESGESISGAIIYHIVQAESEVRSLLTKYGVVSQRQWLGAATSWPHN